MLSFHKHQFLMHLNIIISKYFLWSLYIFVLSTLISHHPNDPAMVYQALACIQEAPSIYSSSFLIHPLLPEWPALWPFAPVMICMWLYRPWKGIIRTVLTFSIAVQWAGTSLTIHCFNILYPLSLQCFQGMVSSKRIICLEASKITTFRSVQYYWALSQLIGWIHESNYWVRLHSETISKNIVSSTSSVCLIL